ncbi:MAG TPA: hypothetical protein VE596_04325 [Gaiellaceae bacterium]|jgi:hypothetical protein|nr:hypothetical protein [Gaiellaceae bacterium]
MSRPARVAAALIAIAVVPLEVVAYFAYRDSEDGQAGLVAPFIVVYALLAIGLVWLVDRGIRAARRKTG